MQRKLRCTVMRGGTSRAEFFHKDDLPNDLVVTERILMAALGSPDPFGRQIDGLGGAVSSTSKVAIIGLRNGEPNTIEYTFGQVDVATPLVDWTGNCGNISSAVGPFAIDEGLIKASEPETIVRIFNTNTKKYIVAHVPVEDGKARVEGNYRISGVPGTGARIALDFESPGGAVTGKLLPTGKPQEVLETETGPYLVSILDAANPFVFVRAHDLGMQGLELGDRVNSDAGLLGILESIRAAAAVKIGMARDCAEATRRSPTLPKVAFVSVPADYTMTSGHLMPGGDLDLVSRMISMGKLHGAYPITGAICTGGAAKVEGTVVYEMIPPERRQSLEVRIGHPSGSVGVGANVERQGNEFVYLCGTVFRTARRIMDGGVYIPEAVFSAA